MFLTEKVAQEYRAKIEELYSTHGWLQVRGKIRELAAHIQLCIDMGTPPPLMDVKELCELLLRVDEESVTKSWDDVQIEARRLAALVIQKQEGT